LAFELSYLVFYLAWKLQGNRKSIRVRTMALYETGTALPLQVTQASREETKNPCDRKAK
jgi:hypothetical protein